MLPFWLEVRTGQKDGRRRQAAWWENKSQKGGEGVGWSMWDGSGSPCWNSWADDAASVTDHTITTMDLTDLEHTDKGSVDSGVAQDGAD